MPATNSRPRRHLLVALAAVATAFGGSPPLRAHPMPDTEITVTRSAEKLDLLIQLPLADLLLVLPPALPRDAETLIEEHLPDLSAYFTQHARLIRPGGPPIPFSIAAIRLQRGSDADVGDYAELEVTASAQVEASVPLTLDYDGVLHKVANHRAKVRDDRGQLIGIIRYGLAQKRATLLLLP